MKLLWLYRYMPTCDYDHHLHMSFARFIATYPGITLKAYGPEIHVGYPRIALKAYNNHITLQDIYQEYKFDVIIVNTKSRCFEHYNPKTKVEYGMWLPQDFSTWNKTPKVNIEEDTHYETEFQWYRDMRFDLILNRHYSQSLRDMLVPNKFFPFSVDTAYFNSWSVESILKNIVIPLPYKREKKIAMVGNSADGAYIMRRLAIDTLIREGVGLAFTGSGKREGEYLKVLRQFVAYVSCGSTYEICAGKNLEIMSSGGLLLTNKFQGIDLLFPENCYASYKVDKIKDRYFIDENSVVEQGKKILNDTDYVVETVRNARECINTRHSHDVRIKEMIDIFKKEL